VLLTLIKPTTLLKVSLSNSTFICTNPLLMLSLDQTANDTTDLLMALPSVLNKTPLAVMQLDTTEKE